MGADVLDVLDQPRRVLADAEAKARAMEEEASDLLRYAEEVVARAHATEHQAAAQFEQAAAQLASAAEAEARTHQAEHTASTHEAAVREDAEKARQDTLEAARTQAAALVNAAEDEAAKIRAQALDELSRARGRAVGEAKRAAGRAQVRLMRFAECAKEDLALVLAAIEKDASGVDRTAHARENGSRG